MQAALYSWLLGLGLTEPTARAVELAVTALAVALVALLSHQLTKRLVLRGVRGLVAQTRTRWDDALVEHHVMSRLAHVAPGLVIYWLNPLVFESHPTLVDGVRKLVAVYMVLAGALVLSAVIDAADGIYRTFEASRRVPLKGLLQVLKVVAFCLAAVVVLALMIDKTPLYILSGFGALTAVLLIVFKDPILGLVGGIQLSANRMVAIGDWIEMPSHNADGDVVEVALTTVKVQNWDMTITTIPTYDLISRPFKNWRGMQDAGGRRIKRSINLDMNSICFCDEKLLSRLSRIHLLQEYLGRKRTELEEYNRQAQVDLSCPVNGRRMTNVGTFRAYVAAYLRSHPKIHKDMTFLIRQLPPGESGLPLEIYVFTNDTAWVNYEGIQSDIFDHLLAVVPEFDLRVFQAPSGADMRQAFGGQRAA